jgi:hypothetical protein
MNSAAFSKLKRLLDAARVAEAVRLCAVLAQAARCRDRAAQLRGQIGAAGEGIVPHIAPGGRFSAPDPAANLLVVSRWRHRLAQQAREEDARAATLEVEAETIRPRVARAFGRYTAAGAMAEKARAGERRLAQSRAEAAIIPPRRAPVQPASPGSASAGSSSIGTSTGSPGNE